MIVFITCNPNTNMSKLVIKDNTESSKLTRIAVVDNERCKPNRCNQECKASCPVVRMGKLCIEVTKSSKSAFISEDLCIGCNICTKKCPFEAISIINLPTSLDSDTIHRYGKNGFKLHRLPIPQLGKVLGLIGVNGIGKSSVIKILAGKLLPNLGKIDNPPSLDEVIKHFRGSELQKYFMDNLKTLIKPQYVDQIPKLVKGKVGQILRSKDQRDLFDYYVTELELTHLLERQTEELSGGELQRFALAISMLQKVDVYIFDEPSSYLDVKQRLKASQLIRELLTPSNYVVVVEHDLSVLDYMSDIVCCLYGEPGAYGVVTMPYGVREGINIFLDGFIPSENIRVRKEPLTFKLTDNLEAFKRSHSYKYPTSTKTYGSFTLNIQEGSFTDSEIIVLCGQNGVGKTSFLRTMMETCKLSMSYKPQKILPKFQGTVKNLLYEKIGDRWLSNQQFKSDVVDPLQITRLLDQSVQDLSGGELQRVAILLCLGKPADIYLLDEPSAYLDAEQRVIVAKIIKRFIIHTHRTAFIVEHDFMMSCYLADRIITYSGVPGMNCTAHSPTNLKTGMNSFLQGMDVTFRRDPTNYRPRINKLDSQMDQEQKENKQYFQIE